MAAAGPGHATRILVVDDDEALNRLICAFLERNGFAVHAAADGLQALDTLDRHPDVGLAIVDLMMPHVDGISLVKRIKEQPGRRDLPVIMISASDDEEKVDQSMRAGVGLFLSKPIDFNRLLTLIRFAG